MKKRPLAIFVILTTLQTLISASNGVKIVGEIKNSNHEYVILAHRTLYRGNLNFDGFQSVGERVNEKGDFVLIPDNLVDAADYWVQVGNKTFSLILFKGDDIQISFDINNLDSSLFAKGKGAGKINILRLGHFKDNLMYDTIYTLNSYKLRVDSVINSQLSILNAIYNKDIKSNILRNAKNKNAIIRIIKESPLSEREYEFLKKKITLQDIYYLGGFPSFLSQHKNAYTSKVDFTNSYFSCFNLSKYKEIENINYWLFEDCINNILKLEYLKNIQHENHLLTYKNFSDVDYKKYKAWSFTYAKSYLKPEVFDAYFANLLSNGLIMGGYNKDLYGQFVNNCSNKKFINRIDQFNNLMKTGLSNTEYNLNANGLSLNAEKLDSLLKKYKGQNIYLIVWSAQYAGATIISELPSIIDFEKGNKDEFKVIYLCIDRPKYKKLWAAQILDNSWKGNHYFLPSDNNDSIINRLNAKNIWAFCDGGVTYSFIDKNGNITNGISAPILMSKEKINQLK